METKANYVAVGIFVLSFAFAGALAALWIAGAQIANEFAIYRTYFQDSVTGLGPGTIVRYNGIDVGNVREVGFDPTDPRRVVADLQIDPELRFRQDAVASLEMQGLTGGIYVQITGGTPGSAFLTRAPEDEFPVITTQQSAIQLLAQETPELLNQLTVLTESGVDLLNQENRAALAESFANIRDITAAFSNRSAEIDATLASLGPTVARLNSALISIDETMVQFGGVATSVDETAQALTQVANGFDEAINRTAVPQIDQLLVEARSLVASLGRLSEAIERQPTQLIFGDRREGYSPQ